MDHIAFCRKFFAATQIPVNLLSCGKPVYSSLVELFSITPPIQWEIYPPQHNPDFCAISPELEYGRVRIEGSDLDIVIGPVFSLPVNDEIIDQFVKETLVPREMREPLAEFFYAIPQTSHHQFCRHLALIHLCVNGKDVNIEDLYREDENRVRSRQQRAAERTLDYADGPPAEEHNSYPFEQQLYQCIRSGSIAGLHELFAQHSLPLNSGRMASSPVRHTKNIFIKVATNAGMLGAIPGGLGVEKTYQLIDSYVQECEQLKTQEEINNLQYMMVLDFCQRVSDTKLPSGLSSEVYRAVSYIRSNTKRQLSVNDVARHVHRSGSYMMKLFREELGAHITAFITQCKLEEAKRLLQYSDRNLAEISDSLCFSSQSYFQNVFKKQYGITPLQYRKQSTKL